MQQTVLDKDMIAQPQLWRLILMPGEERLDVALLPPVAGEEIIWRTFEFDPSTPDRHKALQDIIYENPLLLSDFKSVECIADCGCFMALPAGLDEEGVGETGHAVLAPDDEGCFTLTEPCGASNAVIAQWIDGETHAFLCRTFFNIRFHSRMSHLIDYLVSLPAGGEGARMYALTRGGEMTVVVLHDGRLLCANDFRYRSESDAVYYLLAAAATLGLSPGGLQVGVGGDGAPELVETLRPYLPGVSELDLPELRYRAGRTTLEAPFDILIRQSCE